ncbi:hypothetical protein B0H16DRAFT_1345948 [Mycena metata]|uniref:Uncharacterized protein n=1 Tax=Mycena metata TaxID=1033252 RepID=A0AAD7M8H6_9AGAR|nr:hypothetical protein B0H16DRAFT_1345948 [Mycena metata]
MFVESGPSFINPSRVSPVCLSAEVSTGATATKRLKVDNKVAICVTPIFSSESILIEPKKIGTNVDRTRKWLSGIMHNQEWERFESTMCLVFGELVLYAQLSSKHALAFQTMMSAASSSSSVSVGECNTQFANAPSDMFSPVKATKAPAKNNDSLMHLSVPVYDARKIVVNFEADLDRLDKVLPLFKGEVPFGSFVVVGYTVSSYKAALSSGGEKMPNLGCNILWAIVCGTPILRTKLRT